MAVSSRSRNRADTLRRPGATDACFTPSAGRRARRRPPSSGNATRPTGIENDVERAREGGEKGEGSLYGRSRGEATLEQQFQRAKSDLSCSEGCHISMWLLCRTQRSFILCITLSWREISRLELSLMKWNPNSRKGFTLLLVGTLRSTTHMKRAPAGDYQVRYVELAKKLMWNNEGAVIHEI